jgi:RHS repeat-associated protein
MTVDKNKKITAITYNHLNLPTKIIFPTGNIVYIYNAAGQKVQKVVTENTTVTTTDYLGGYQYKNAVLQFFPTAEGYVKNTANVFSYVFNYTDHLGNVRLSYTKNPSTNALTILEESNYYPFGLKHSPYNAITPAQDYKYRYNSKEYQDELSLNLYDCGARNYDPALGRWMNVDPLAETSRRFSPYVYALSNPVLFIDPDGMEAYKSQVDRSSEMSNSEWNSNRRADMDRQAGGDGIDIANPDGYVKPKYTVTASDADNEVEKEEGDSNEDKPKKKKSHIVSINLEDPKYRIEFGMGLFEYVETGGLKFLETTAKIVKESSIAEKTVVIGEDMTKRVIPFAEKNGYKYFKPRGTNPENWMRNQSQWIYRQIKDPTVRIIDIGSKGIEATSKYYKKELEMIKKYLGN